MLFYLVSLSWAFYIGRFEVVYGAGAGVVIFLQGFGLVAMLIYALVSRSLLHSFYITLIVLTSLNTLLIVGHEIGEYRPTYTLTIPADYEGCVYLFTTDAEPSDFNADTHGIAYSPKGGKYLISVEQDGVDITDVLQSSNMNALVIYSEDSTLMTNYHVACININAEKNYPTESWDRSYPPCMDVEEFQYLIELGWIDESRLRETVYTRTSDGTDWEVARLQGSGD